MSDQPSLLDDQVTDESPPSIVIIGGGASGMSSVIRLLEHGIQPIIIEKEEELGGAGIHAGRFFAIESAQQKELNIEDSVQQMLEEWSTITGKEPDNTLESF